MILKIFSQKYLAKKLAFYIVLNLSQNNCKKLVLPKTKAKRYKYVKSASYRYLYLQIPTNLKDWLRVTGSVKNGRIFIGR
jgi:hypothetical protein